MLNNTNCLKNNALIMIFFFFTFLQISTSSKLSISKKLLVSKSHQCRDSSESLKIDLTSKSNEQPITTLKGEFKNGTNDIAIPTSELEGLVLEFKCKDGSVFPSTVEGSKYSVDLRKGVYSVTIKTKNFSEYRDEITIDKEKNQEKNFLLSPSARGAVRVILVWNQIISDLDLWTKTSKNEVINYRSKSSQDGTIHLDVDKRTAFGPETVTIDEKNKDDKIQFFVNNYSNEDILSQSGANVKVYIDNQLVENLNVPNSSESTKLWWEVGTYDRSTNKFLKSDKLIQRLP